MTRHQEMSAKRAVVRRLIAKLEESPVTTTTPSNRHEALREYILALLHQKSTNDPFLQHLLSLTYRDGTVKANGIFRRVRDLHDAVIAAGGTLDDARTWTGQALRWWRTGKAVDQKYARLEIDPRAARAMDDLLSFLQALPVDLLKPEAVGLLLPRQFPPGQKPPDKPQTQPPQNPFGNRSPFGSQPPTPPKPPSPFGNSQTQKPSSAFGNRQPFGRPAPDALPYHVAWCFDVLGVTPDSLASEDIKPIEPLEWLEALAQRDAGTTPPPETQPEPLPTDFKGLLDRLHRAGNAKQMTEFDRVLEALGKLNDMRALDHLYNLTRDSGTDGNLLDVFAVMGGDVGIAGLISLLPLESDKRETWLNALLQVTRRAMTSDQPLSAVSLDTLWHIALAESAPNIEFCPAALHLLAATRRPEAQPVLWEHAHANDVRRVRTALAALTQLDPGDKLDDLLAAIGNAPDMPPRPPTFPFGAPTFNPDAAPVGIPFERLAAVVLGPKIKLRASALGLLSRIDDPRVMPFLIGQLTRRVPRVREVALNQLRRLKAAEAADAVADLMDRDTALRQRAAEMLCEWGDPRCVPVLLPLIASEEPDKVIRRLGKLGHPDFEAWLLNKVETLDQDNQTAGEKPLTEIIKAVSDLEADQQRAVLQRLTRARDIMVRLHAIRALGKLDHDWAQAALYALITDDDPPVSYVATMLYKGKAGTRTLLDSASELRRILGVRLLWRDKDSAALIECLSDRSQAVRDTALWALANQPSADAAAIFRWIVAHEDRIDSWNINRAVIAWRGLAKLNARAVDDSVVPIAS
ncbi:MAG: HEAT repeat domain-containing protein [Anaerolineae bacterium]|nr:HEAT repeat domain-containing protein [Anaerolineae bacterium]